MSRLFPSGGEIWGDTIQPITGAQRMETSKNENKRVHGAENGKFCHWKCSFCAGDEFMEPGATLVGLQVLMSSRSSEGFVS